MIAHMNNNQPIPFIYHKSLIFLVKLILASLFHIEDPILMLLIPQPDDTISLYCLDKL